MALETILLLVGLGMVAALLLALILRKPATDPAIGMLQAAQERQGERLVALSGDMKAALSASEVTLAREMSALTTKLMEVQAATAQAQQQGVLEARENAGRLRQENADAAARVQVMVEQVRAALAESQATMKSAIAQEMAAARDVIDRKGNESRAELEAKLREMREANDKRLAEIQASVNEQLGAAVEKQMSESFTRVIDQFNAIQAMMGNVQSVASQVGDLKRLFSNVKTRGGWGEAQVKALLDDFLPQGSYEMNVKLRDGSNDTVEFAILMPVGQEAPVRLPVDAKFPVEDYERLLQAHDAGEMEAEAQARKGLEARIRGEALKIRDKYINPPTTTEFAVMYLPTEGLYAEVARIPGLIDDIGRNARVFIAGPSLLPAMLRTIQLGHVTLALSKNAESVRELLSATKAEMAKMDGVLEKLGRQVTTVGNSIGEARTRTRSIARKLKDVEAMPGDQAASMLGVEGAASTDEDDPPA
ncbi:MAG: DNA recombination protein RmuC [Alphaproteobacteria bacterium]|jgi:DNA recombination protein RmuC